jgi:hypothetical protein
MELEATATLEVIRAKTMLLEAQLVGIIAQTQIVIQEKDAVINALRHVDEPERRGTQHLRIVATGPTPEGKMVTEVKEDEFIALAEEALDRICPK